MLNLLSYLLTILLTVLCLVFVVSTFIVYYKSSENKYEFLERNPSLVTKDYDQHIRRLNKFRSSNYKGITYYFSKKGGLYYYSKDNVRIYM